MTDYAFSKNPKKLDKEVADVILHGISQIPEVLEVYTQYSADEDDSDDDEMKFFFIFDEMQLHINEKISTIENDIIDSLPEDYTYRYAFGKLYQKDGQVEAIVEREALKKIYP